MKNKKFVFVFAIICILVFLFIYYIFSIFGNNRNRSKEEIVEKLLNSICNYEATITVEVTSNKTKNVYEMYQVVENDNSKLIVKSPEEIKDLTMEIENGTLKIKNTKQNMEKVYEEYEAIINNNLFLDTFSKEAVENELISYEENGELILELKLNNSNTYTQYKELHFDLELMAPKELQIKDNTKKINIRIIYNDIKIK